MKLEVGMYVRTKDGTIDRIVEDENGVCSCPSSNAICCEKHILATFIITKASHNIIDLIEEGDYVNGHQVYEVDRECCRITLNGGSYGDEFRLTYLRPALGENMGIKSIVTKEQFSSISYEVSK